MWPISNPAATLFAGLSKFAAVANSQITIDTAWSKALQVEPERVGDMLGELLIEVPRVANTLEALGQADLAYTARRYEGRWTRPILDRSPTSKALITSDSLSVLQMAAGVIGAAGVTQAARVAKPARDELKKLLRDAQDVLMSTTDDELARDLRLALLDAVSRALAALGTYAVSGEDGVREAIERLAFVVSSIPEPVKRKRAKWVASIASVVGIAWTFFLTGPKVEEAADAWARMLQLPGVSEVIHERLHGPREIEAPPLPPEIEPAPAVSQDSEDVIDAEVVEDESPDS